MRSLYLVGVVAAIGSCALAGAVGGVIFLTMGAVVVEIIRENS